MRERTTSDRLTRHGKQRGQLFTRDAAVAEIPRRHRELMDIFENARAKTRGALSR
jgi:hypothetical protein